MVKINTKTTSGNWTAVFPAIDLETIPLEIKTNSTSGSGDQVWVDFYTAEWSTAGRVQIRFFSTPAYYISYCMYYYSNFPVSLPTEVEKVWRITLNRNSGIRLRIHCNNVEVLNFVMSSYRCDNHRYSYWSSKVGKIQFHRRYDTASKYFRAGQPGINARIFVQVK